MNLFCGVWCGFGVRRSTLECFGVERDGFVCAFMCYTVLIIGSVRLFRDSWVLFFWLSGDFGVRVFCVVFCYRGESIVFRIGCFVGIFEVYCICVLIIFFVNMIWVNLNMFCLFGNVFRVWKFVIGFIVF